MNTGNNRPCSFPFSTPAEFIKISLLGFAVSGLWSSLHTIVLPVLLLGIVGEGEKNSRLGLITFCGLVAAMVVQPLAGALSDRTASRLGKRRPYILLGTILALLVIPFIGLIKSYPLLLLTVCLLQTCTNTAQGPYQAFIPELVPAGSWGWASGVKSLFEILGGVALLYPVAGILDRYTATGTVSWLYLAVGIPAAVLLFAGLFTVVLVREPPASRNGASFSLLQTYLRVDFRRHRHLAGFLVSRLLFFLAFTTVQSFALYFLRDVAGVPSPAKATAGFMTLAFTGMLISVYPAGRFSDRMGRRRIGVAAGLIGAVGLLLIFLFRNSYGLIVFSAGLIGVSFGAFLSTNWALATDLAPQGDEGRHFGTANLAAVGGSALARLVGPVIDFFNRSSPNAGYSVMLLICFASLVTGSVILSRVKR